MMSAVSRKREPSAGLQHNNFRDLRNAVPLCEIFKGTPLYNFTNSPCNYASCVVSKGICKLGCATQKCDFACAVNYILCVALKPFNKLREASSSRSARKT